MIESLSFEHDTYLLECKGTNEKVEPVKRNINLLHLTILCPSRRAGAVHLPMMTPASWANNGL